MRQLTGLFFCIFLALAVSISPGQEYKLVDVWPKEIRGFRHPAGVAIDGSGNVYVADSGNHCIQKFDSEGNFLMKWGTEGEASGQFGYLEDVEVDDSGKVYVAETHRIQKFDSEGNFLTEWGTESGDSPCAYDLAVSKSGDIYVADYSNHRIKVYRFVYRRPF